MSEERCESSDIRYIDKSIVVREVVQTGVPSVQTTTTTGQRTAIQDPV